MTVYRWEWGVSDPTRSDCALIADALGTTPEWVAFGVGDGPGTRRKVACAR